jgi:hypothetical protein
MQESQIGNRYWRDETMGAFFLDNSILVCTFWILMSLPQKIGVDICYPTIDQV